ncbi:interleukin-5 receptor subunit alpha-like isoform X2 [Hyperolius riggenbachi]|uniref:interleukin-5 receptor subunit alpha-like isoform X2 n=1 Tax=Hyperolius riggenbachi TaxID=752182 RepID=UPI0035A3289A
MRPIFSNTICEMDTAACVVFCCLMWQCCYSYEDFQECNTLNGQLQPINISVELRGNDLAVAWECDFLEETPEDTAYEIYLKRDSDTEWHYETQASTCYEEITVIKDSKPHFVCLKLVPTLQDKPCQDLSSETCVDIETNGTSAENVSCRVYNTSSMTCSWMSGRKAPHNTTYILSIKQEKTYLVCQHYENNLLNSTGSCTFHDLRVHFFEDVTVILQGSNPGIQVHEERIKLAHKEIFNPPRNIKVSSFKENVKIEWHSPQKQYQAAADCFEYEIEKNKASYYTKSNQYTIASIAKECLVRIRAKGTKVCDMNTQWGEWSPIISCGPRKSHEEKTLYDALIPTVGITILILVFLIASTFLYKRILNICLPRIPEPHNYLDFTGDSLKNIKDEYFFKILPNLENELHDYIVVENVP